MGGAGMTEPFLKWVGAKRRLIDQLRQLLPSPARTHGYRQPFLGGGSPFWQVYSEVRPAVLSDTNERLVETYLAVRDHVEELIAELRRHELFYSADHYYKVRESVNARREPLVQRAAYFIIINRWGFNGLWRVNPKGQCNVAFGKTASGAPPVLCDEAVLRGCSRALRGADIRHDGFEATLAGAREGEVVYLDPPYHPTSETADFTAYTPDGFSYATEAEWLFGRTRSAHERLVWWLAELDRRGVAWTLSNSDCAATRAAYAGWEIATVQRSGGINCDPTKRGKVSEIVVRGKVRLDGPRFNACQTAPRTARDVEAISAVIGVVEKLMANGDAGRGEVGA